MPWACHQRAKTWGRGDMSKVFSTTDPGLIKMIVENERERSLAEPLTDEERQQYTRWAQKNYYSRARIYRNASAGAFLAYEATLQAKDEQIERLVEGILGIDEWMSGRSCHLCPFCKGAIGEHKDGCLRSVAGAIKEATQ